jgi:hypothetical protein
VKLTQHEPLRLDDEEFAILNELLESERTKLLAGLRQADRQLFGDRLRRRLAVVERLVEQAGAVAICSAE